MAMDSGQRQIFDFPGKAKSDVWSHFGFYLTDDSYNLDKSRAICKYCRIGVKYTGNTTNLHTHYINHHLRKDFNKQEAEGESATSMVQSAESMSDTVHMPPAISASFNHPPKTQTKLSLQTYAIMEYIIEDMLPLSTLSSKAFQNMVRTMNPKCDLPSRKYVEEVVVLQLYEESQVQIMANLDGQEAVSLTTDIWRTSETHVTVSVNFISKTWHLNTYVLQTLKLPDEVTSEHVFDALKSVTETWNIICEPILVLGHETAMYSADALTWRNIACFAQSINNAAIKGLAAPAIQNVIVACKKLSQFFRCSVDQNGINAALAGNTLLVANNSQWNSTFAMLERIVEHYPSIKTAFLDTNLEYQDAQHLLLDVEGLKLCQDLVTLLKPLNNASMLLCDQKMVTASMILPVLKKLEITLLSSESECPVIKECRSIIWKEIQASYSSESIREFLLVCSLLDPRYKELRYIDAVEREKARRLLYDAALKPLVPDIQIKQEVDSDDEYIQSIILGPAFSLTSQSDSQPAGEPAKKKKKTTPQAASKDWLSDVVGHSDDLASKKMNPVELVSSEIDRFMTEKQITWSNPLIWWYEREKIFPNLSSLAKRHMCVMATATRPEDVFMTDHETMKAKRERIPEDLIDTMIFLNKNHKNLKLFGW